MNRERPTRPGSSYSFQFALLFTLSLMMGCGDEVGRVTGTVKLNGAPVGPGSIIFRPSNPTSTTAPSGSGRFKEDGAYVIKISRGLEELPVGDYEVIIDGTPKESSGDETVIAGMVNPIPIKYLDPAKSGLTVTIQPGKNTHDFDLKP